MIQRHNIISPYHINISTKFCILGLTTRNHDLFGPESGKWRMAGKIIKFSKSSDYLAETPVIIDKVKKPRGVMFKNTKLVILNFMI